MLKKRLSAKELRNKGVKAKRVFEFIGIASSTYYYKSVAPEEKDKDLLLKIKQLAFKFSFYGYRRIYRCLRNEGIKINHKKVYRIYKSLNLQKTKKKRKKFVSEPCSFTVADKKNMVWATDFVQDRLSPGRSFRIIAVEDIYSRMVVGCRVNLSINSSDVVEVLNQAVETYGKPRYLRSDNGPEYISRTLATYLEKERISHERIEKGKPVQNGHAESFIGRLREECLNMHVFKNIADAQKIIGSYIRWYNNERLHSSLGYKTPAEVFGTTANL